MSAQRYIVRKQRQWYVVRDTAFRPSDFVEKFETREAAQFHANDLNERDAGAEVAAAEERGAAKERERLAEEVAMVETWRAAVVGMARRLHEIEQQVEPADAAAEYLDALERSTDSPRLKAAVQSVRRGAS